MNDEFRINAPDASTGFFFYEGSECIGRLTWKDGKFSFSGDADEAAQNFFDNLLAIHTGLYEENAALREALRTFPHHPDLPSHIRERTALLESIPCPSK